ncbi:MAG TPA: pyridoxal phosphate-dependent aminotransferase [Oscillospiraceae bacterium]|nr:pyridoxal phosphate-dependent aminotransferase [Oscillospiraceae bacterium]
MKSLSKFAVTVQASTTLAIDAMYKKMKADGVDVLGFGAGEPDFNTPEFIKEAGILAIRTNQTRYTPAAGTEALRRAVCARLGADYGLSYAPEQVVVASGAKHCMFLAFMALLDPGDEVLLPAPYWVSYYEMIRMAGGVPVILETTAEDGFRVAPRQLEAAVTPRTKALLLNNPSNPTGMLYDRAALTDIAGVCVRHDLYVIADEIYASLVYDGETFVSFPSLGEEVKKRTILVNGVSKSYAMTGWRIGYAAAERSVAKVMANYVSHSTSAPSTISQAAALAALTGPQDEIATMRAAFEARRNYLVSRMEKIKGVTCVRPEGAFYVMMGIGPLLGKTLHGKKIEDADDFCGVFLEKGLVALVPGTGFGAPTYVRWSYATDMDTIRAGLDRLEKFLAE